MRSSATCCATAGWIRVSSAVQHVRSARNSVKRNSPGSLLRPCALRVLLLSLLLRGWPRKHLGGYDGLESSEDRRSLRRHGNQHVCLRDPQVITWVIACCGRVSDALTDRGEHLFVGRRTRVRGLSSRLATRAGGFASGESDLSSVGVRRISLFVIFLSRRPVREDVEARCAGG